MPDTGLELNIKKMDLRGGETETTEKPLSRTEKIFLYACSGGHFEPLLSKKLLNIYLCKCPCV